MVKISSIPPSCQVGRRLMLQGSVALATAAMAASPRRAKAQAALGKFKLGVLSDFTSLFSASGGEGLVVAVRMAVKDFQAEHPDAGFDVEVVFADHQNSPDIGATAARQWFDAQGVDVALDVVNSPIALAVGDIARSANRVMLVSGSGSTRLTGDQCSPNTVQWTYDTYSYGHAIGDVLTREGGTTWYFVTADYGFGHDLQEQTADAVTRAGGRVIGATAHPLGTQDFSSFLLQAQASGAKVVGLANAGGDVVNAVKQAAEFGLPQTQRIAAINVGLNDVFAMSLPLAQGLTVVEPFYWDMNEGTRAWTKRFVALYPKNYPSMHHAGCYAATLHYLRAVAVVKTHDGKRIVEQMKAMPTNDPLFGTGSIRVDGRKMHPLFVFQVKSPEESKYPWDYYKLMTTIPAEKAFRPLAEGGCPFLRT